MLPRCYYTVPLPDTAPLQLGGRTLVMGIVKLLDRPLLVGPSRKSFLGGDGDGGPDDREWGTAAAVTAAVLDGAHIVRVHGVREMVQVVRVADRIRAHGAVPESVPAG